MSQDLIERDLKHLWHPCSQMKDYEEFPPEVITHAQGPLLYRENGTPLIDMISSWWCKSLGHRHPNILKSVYEQMEKFDHVILADTTNSTIVELVENLSQIHPNYQRSFFADSGSDAVEIACKMSLQYHAQTGNPQRKDFMSLENGYHGETILTLALGDCEIYSKPYASIIPKTFTLTGIPYCLGIEDPIWHNIGEEKWTTLEAQLDAQAKTLSAIIIEPLIQGAGGMLIYSADFLKRLAKWCKSNGVHLIADEIMTGMGRAGHYRACEWSNVVPDFSVFSKGLTGGFAPMSVVLTNNQIYDAFYDDYETGKAFLHSHTYCGNAISAAAALGALKTYKEERIFERVQRDSKLLKEQLDEIQHATGRLQNIRHLGFIAAAEITNKDGSALPSDKRIGNAVYREALKRGALLRPLGNTIYFLPPLNIEMDLVKKTTAITIDSIREVLGK